MSELLTGVISIIIGIFIGWCLDLLKYRYKANEKLYDTYTALSKEVAEVLKSLLDLSLHPKGYSDEELDKIKKDISAIYFKYYIFLPQEVLLELNCMHSCLQSRGRWLYKVDEKSSFKTIYRCSDTEIIKDFCHDATLIKRGLDKLDSIIATKKMPVYLKLNFQARMVIRKIDDLCGSEKIFKWTKYLKKKTVYNIEMR